MGNALLVSPHSTYDRISFSCERVRIRHLGKISRIGICVPRVKHGIALDCFVSSSLLDQIGATSKEILLCSTLLPKKANPETDLRRQHPKSALMPSSEARSRIYQVLPANSCGMVKV